MMRREKVEHILRAAGVVTGKSEFVLIGSAAIVAWHATLPEPMVVSRDIDLFAYDAPDAESVSEQLDGALGQASQFARAMRFSNPNTGGVTAIVPEPHDIALSKLCAGRPKDMAWLRAAIAHGIIAPDLMRARLRALPERAGDRAALAARLDGLS